MPKVFILAVSASYEKTSYTYYNTYQYPAGFCATKFFTKVYQEDVF
jgi:hypothetical protein